MLKRLLIWRKMEEYELICVRLRRCKLIELCNGKGVIIAGGRESDCLDYQSQRDHDAKQELYQGKKKRI